MTLSTDGGVGARVDNAGHGRSQSGSSIITSAARESLKPLGLVQRGRSRLWIDDHAWWLGVVEFTSPRTAGSGLHVGAMWLWHDVDHLAFHVDAVRVGSESFRTEDQFMPLALELSRQAAANVTALREQFPALPDVARYLASRPVRRGFLWDGFDAGIAAALAGTRTRPAITSSESFERTRWPHGWSTPRRRHVSCTRSRQIATP
ncbi:hypothetical protein ABZ722_37100 [Streptomyces longwoodensis]|uniref:hypothetical protein n=1 Tax=Streptomyces longwoodensis TaxID=68231 RepID=UPI003411A435